MKASSNSHRREWISFIVLAFILLALQLILPSKMMAAEILIMAFPTLAFILLLGYTGQLSFGTGSLFAVGAYTTGILIARYDTHVLVAIAAGVMLTGIIASIVGFFCIRQVGLIFALLTLAFNQLVWFIIWQWRGLTGGPDGIWGIQRSSIDFGLFSFNIKPSFNFYILVLVLFLLTFLLVRRLIASPFGKVLQGMRDSELRATAIGYRPITYKWMSFVITGMMCGLGGALFALHQEYVGEHLASWTTSGEVVMMALLGGSSVLIGAVIGSGAFILLSDLLNQITALARAGGWLFILGIIFILVVMFLKGGLYGGAESIYGWVRERFGSSSPKGPQSLDKGAAGAGAQPADR
ncbi:MAG: branched-chain amino acid ABC transporter permease [Pseudomonadota bacterium]